MHRTQAPNATTKRYHQTQALMGATRPASVFNSLVLHRFFSNFVSRQKKAVRP